MSKELSPDKYCIKCGRPLKIVRRVPWYDGTTGKLTGHHLDMTCSSNPILHLLRCHYVVYGDFIPSAPEGRE